MLIARTPALAAHRTTQIWSRDDLASRWGLDSAELGLEDGGTGLTWQQASEIRLPGRQEVSAYAAAAFHDVEEAVALLDERLLMLTLPGPTLYPSQSEPDTYGGNVLIWIEHNREHVGVIQALRGMQGLTGGLD